MPLYNFICAIIRFIGVLNSMTTTSGWNSTPFKTEMQQIWSVFRRDLSRNRTK
nr:hypothetical protein [Secundilactobacillus oryzae]